MPGEAGQLRPACHVPDFRHPVDSGDGHARAGGVERHPVGPFGRPGRATARAPRRGSTRPPRPCPPSRPGDPGRPAGRTAEHRPGRRAPPAGSPGHR
jgi:hypothetical protein